MSLGYDIVASSPEAAALILILLLRHRLVPSKEDLLLKSSRSRVLLIADFLSLLVLFLALYGIFVFTNFHASPDPLFLYTANGGGSGGVRTLSALALVITGLIGGLFFRSFFKSAMLVWFSFGLHELSFWAGILILGFLYPAAWHWFLPSVTGPSYYFIALSIIPVFIFVFKPPRLYPLLAVMFVLSLSWFITDLWTQTGGPLAGFYNTTVQVGFVDVGGWCLTCVAAFLSLYKFKKRSK